MRLAFVCQAVDREHPIHAGTLEWIRAVEGEPEVEGVFVITLTEGVHDLPETVRVEPVREGIRIRRGLHFLALVGRAVRWGADEFFIYQGGPYPLLLAPFRFLGAFGVHQWKAHPKLSLRTRWMARWCVDNILTSTPHAFPADLQNVHVIGTSVDCELFAPVESDGPSRDLLLVSRLSPVKRIERAIRAVAAAKRDHGRELTASVVGPTVDRDYAERLRALAADEGVEDLVVFTGPVERSELPGIMSGHRLFAFFGETALDRAVVEAMATGTPVYSSNPCVEDVLPPELAHRYVTSSTDPGEIASDLVRLFSSGERLREDGRAMRKLVLQHHSQRTLGRRILRVVRGDGRRGSGTWGEEAPA